MAKFISPEQLLANQQNAQKSTGPKTTEGKDKSSRNATKHDLLAGGVVINSPMSAEDRSEFDTLLADLCNELQPRGFIQKTLVERIATCYWRLHRVQRFENGAIRESLEIPEYDENDAILAMHQKELILNEKRLAIMDRVAQLFEIPPDKLDAAQQTEIAQLAAQIPNPYPATINGLRPPLDPKELRVQLSGMLAKQRDEVDELRGEVKTGEEKSVLRQSRRTLVSSLPDDAALLKSIRYETMLDRQIYRAFAEFRRIRDIGLRSRL